MARSRVRSASGVFISAFFILIIFGLFFASLASASVSESSASPSADYDLICHTDDPKDCYPRVFQPTDEFQIVHDDQELPSGLHVRLDIWTGKKEAKINVPSENDAALDGLPVDSSVVVVEPEAPEQQVIRKGAPAYDPVGKIRKPVTESQSFYDALTTLKKGQKAAKRAAFDVMLESLEDISHDIYYGLKITEDEEVVKSLFCLMTGGDSQVPPDGTVPQDQQAAMILAGALQNNPTALSEVAKLWPSLMKSSCVKKGPTLQDRVYASFMPSEAILVTEIPRAVAKARAQVSVINCLLKNQQIRDDFMAHNGMSRLLEVMVPAGEEWAPAQKKVGQLLLDNFLDEDMGAIKGIFPTAASLKAEECQSAETLTSDGCWDHHVARIMEVNRKDDSHWSKDVHQRLLKARKEDASERKAGRTKEEL